ncbi:MAG: CBS domain-containing protein [candidate division Zixibacteria bacterium]|nr:CBS domain-containing protein [candidate division Zixibacteria bacterium]
MDTKTAGGIMIPIEKYPHIQHNYTLLQAIIEFEKASLEVFGRKSLPRVLLVFDEKYQILGLVRRRDIFRGLEPEFLQNKPLNYQNILPDMEIDPNLAEISFAGIDHKMKETAQRPVSDVMIPIAATVDVDDHISKIMYLMVSKNLALLPVTKDGKVVGVVRSVGVFYHVAKHLGVNQYPESSTED